MSKARMPVLWGGKSIKYANWISNQIWSIWKEAKKYYKSGGKIDNKEYHPLALGLGGNRKKNKVQN